MKVQFSQEFPFTLEDVIRARNYRFNNIEKFSEMNSQKIIEHREEDGVRYLKRLLSSEEKIPPLLVSMIPENMLNLIQESWFDKKNLVSDFKIYSENTNDNSFLLTGSAIYEPINNESSRRRFTMNVDVKIPIVGKLISSFISDTFQKRLEKDQNSIITLLRDGLPPTENENS